MIKNRMPLQAGLMQFLVLFGLMFVGVAAPAAEQQGKRDDASHGAGPSVHGEELTLFNFVGHIKQDGPTLVAYGYLTHIYGLDDADLFAGASPTSPGDPRYTFVTNGTLVGRFIVGDGTPGNTIFNIVANVSTTYYFEDQGAQGCVGPPSATCPEDPSPFESGTPIATAAGRDSDVNNIQSPNKGVLSGSGGADPAHGAI